MSTPLTCVVPTYAPHFPAVRRMLRSVSEYASDKESVVFRLVIDEDDRSFFECLCKEHSDIQIEMTSTEEALASLGVTENPPAFLDLAGKFTYQSLKKIGGIVASDSDWALVIDSESTFVSQFSFSKLLSDYASQKYVFYTPVSQRGTQWRGSLSERVTESAASLVGGGPDRWYMEYYHWFYEVQIWRDLVAELRLNSTWNEVVGDDPVWIFENVLYYQYVITRERGYNAVDLERALRSTLPPPISARIKKALQGPLAVVGLLEYVLRILTPAEVIHLRPLFDRYRLPFIRVEAAVINPDYLVSVRHLPHVCAIISSHRLPLFEKPVAVCIAGQFRDPLGNIAAVKAFVSGVTCDLYVHMWESDDVASVRMALAPTELLVEPEPDYSDLASAVAYPEPDLKPGRDEGALLMLHGIQQSIRMLDGRADNYSFIVRIRPDIVFERSLAEMLITVVDDEDDDARLIYVPDTFQSQGMNDQVAVGRPSAMAIYGSVFDYATMMLSREYFNPECAVAANLLDNTVKVKVFPVVYVLLRDQRVDLFRLKSDLDHQRAIWWSAPIPGPGRVRSQTELLAIKRRAINHMRQTGVFSDTAYTISAAPLEPASAALTDSALLKLRIHRELKNPACTVTADVSRHGDLTSYFVRVREGCLQLCPDPPAVLSFITPGPSPESLLLSQVSHENALLTSEDALIFLHPEGRWRDRLLIGESLEAGRSLRSLDGTASLNISANGDLQIVDLATRIVVWSAGARASEPGCLRFSRAGRLELLDRFARVYWASGTVAAAAPNSWAVLQADYNFVMYNESGPLWASDSHRPKVTAAELAGEGVVRRGFDVVARFMALHRREFEV